MPKYTCTDCRKSFLDADNLLACPNCGYMFFFWIG